MNAPSQDIAALLDADSSVALTLATDLFVSQMPPTPDACVCVYDTGGFDPDVLLDSDPDIRYEKPTIQIMVRGGKGLYQTAYATAEVIRNYLHLLTETTQGGTRYVAIWQQGDIIALGFDDNHRPLLSVNFRIHRTET